MEECRGALKTLTGKPTRKKPLGSLCVDGWTILELILKKQGVNMKNWIDSAQDKNYSNANEGQATEMKGIGRRTQLRDNLRNRRRYWELKEET